MAQKLEAFTINDLWGEKRVDLKFKDNNLIIVGENGSGKTTILRILYETLACKWAQLSTEEFSSIIVTINGKKIKIEREKIEGAQELFFDMEPSILRELPLVIRQRIHDTYELSGKNITYSELLELLNDYNYADDSLLTTIQEKIKNVDASEINRYTKKVQDSFNYRILYMPSYRRVEKRIGFRNERDYARNRRPVTFRNYPQRLADERVLEIAKTGMDDVEFYISASLYDIKQHADMSATRLNYQCFKGILNKTSYDIKYDASILTSESIERVFGSINEEVLSPDESKQIKEQLMKMGVDQAPDRQSYEQIVYYFYHMLYERYSQIKAREQTILNFFEACNQYLVNKKFIYDEKGFSYIIEIQNDKENRRNISLEKLSSGEKQIVSMFSYLYLSPARNTIILIDEPELSLSVPWQKKYLIDIASGDSCAGLITVTHSPFVFDNNLKQYARSLEEFIC